MGGAHRNLFIYHELGKVNRKLNIPWWIHGGWIFCA